MTAHNALVRWQSTWTPIQVSEWLETNSVDKEIAKNFVTHRVSGSVLAMLDKQDLKSMKINLVGDQLYILRLIQISSPLRETRLFSQPSRDDCPISSCQLEEEHCRQHSTTPRASPLLGGGNSDELDPAFTKLGVSFLYAFLVFGLTSFVMVVVHQRLPDMTKYPPLPDIILENIPHIPWAFEASEAVGMVLFFIWCIVLLLHKHRFIIMRRFFSITGTVFLLRCVTMFLTSLSVPGRHLHESCSQARFNTLHEKVSRALEIWLGLGMSINGVKTCGDYMFSGHTCSLVLLNFFITEYTPRRFHALHTFTWLLNMFGIFFILAAHEHYSIDVFVAFYISSRLFLYYHWMANNKSLLKHDKDRARLWFPLFNYFESNVDGVLPCQMDAPQISWPWELFSRRKTD